jgi:PAT family beta-lactamase induction signal transducer AmpG
MVTTGYRIAMLISGGLALVLADYVGFEVTYLIMACLMLGNLLLTKLAPRDRSPPSSPKNLRTAVIEPFKDFLVREKAVWFLLLIVLYKLGDAFALSLNTPFFIRLTFTLSEIGMVSKIVGLAATLLGVLIGGLLMPRLRLYRALLLFGILQALSNLLFMVLALTGKSVALLTTVIFVEYMTGGMGTVAFIALLMSLCHKEFTATQYALLSALSAVGRVFVGPGAGAMVEWIGWAQFYFWTFVIALPGIAMVYWLRRSILRLEKANG